MGMFDDIYCKYPLPLPEDTKGYVPLGFQTKDLENALNRYEIRDDGTLWLYESEYECSDVEHDGWPIVVEKNARWTFINLTQKVTMYDYQHADGPYDYHVEFDVVFVDGVINKLNMTRFETMDNTERKENNRKFIEDLKLRKQFESTLRYKFIYSKWNKIVYFVSIYMNKIGNFLANLSFKIRQRLVI